MFEFMRKVTYFLGRDKSWMIGNVRVYLWPFVALAIFVAGIATFDYFYYG